VSIIHILEILKKHQRLEVCSFCLFKIFKAFYKCYLDWCWPIARLYSSAWLFDICYLVKFQALLIVPISKIDTDIISDKISISSFPRSLKKAVTWGNLTIANLTEKSSLIDDPRWYYAEIWVGKSPSSYRNRSAICKISRVWSCPFLHPWLTTVTVKLLRTQEHFRDLGCFYSFFPKIIAESHGNRLHIPTSSRRIVKPWSVGFAWLGLF